MLIYLFHQSHLTSKPENRFAMNENIELVQPWPTAQKWLFRFAFLFFNLFILLNPNSVMLFLGGVYRYYAYPVHRFIVYIMHKPLSLDASGSGDSEYYYLLLLFIIIVSAAGTVVWSALDRKTANYNKLYYWLLVVLRFYVGITMVNYGLAKVIKTQFPFPGASRLLETYGNSSPMGLAWTFMGYSTAYNYFMGFAELSCGLLLFFRRTSLLGAIIGIGVIANIVAINYCFDIPVKIISTTLLVMTIVILLKDIKRLNNIFFLNKAIEPADNSPYRFKAHWKNTVLIIVKCFIIAAVIITNGFGSMQRYRMYGKYQSKSILSGIFNTQTFVLNKDTLPPLTTNTVRWKKIITGGGYATIYLMNDSVSNYMITTDTVARKITIGIPSNTQYNFNYTISKDSVLTLDGTDYQGAGMHITLKKFDDKQFPLVKRGFHWINDLPYNR